MGKKLNALIGRSSKTAKKLNTLVNLAISRIAIIKNLHSVKCLQAESDVIQLLQLAYQEQALIRVEQVIKEQNALDAYVMIENYCHLLLKRTEMVENTRECPDELNETISTLIFAASRCGEFPELQEIRVLLTSKFGKEFTASAVELRQNCKVYSEMIQRFSTQQSSLETRQNLLKQIAKHNGITLQLNHEAFDFSNKEKHNDEHLHTQISNGSASFETHKTKAIPTAQHFHDAAKISKPLSESVEARKTYKDVETAAQDASEYAARAVRELSRLESWNVDSDDDSGPHYQGTQYDSLEISETQTSEDEAPGEVNYLELRLKLDLH